MPAMQRSHSLASRSPLSCCARPRARNASVRCSAMALSKVGGGSSSSCDGDGGCSAGGGAPSAGTKNALRSVGAPGAAVAEAGSVDGTIVRARFLDCGEPRTRAAKVCVAM